MTAIVIDAMAGVGRKDVSNLIRDHAATPREIAFIDRNVDDLATLLAGLRPELDPILLSDDEPALCQIARLVRRCYGLDAIHVIAHGRVGEVSFGAGALSLESLAGHAADLRAIGQALGNDGKLLLWSCNTAAGARGSAFLAALESATGAEVCAATGTIGSRPLGGRWELDVSSGKETVEAPLTARGMAGYAGVLAPPKQASLTAITTDSGTVGDFITNDNTPIFSGNERGISTLGIWISGGIYGTGNGGKGTLIGTVPTNSSNKSSSWSFNYAGTALADGTYTVSLTDGSDSGASALSTQLLTIDTVAPGVPIISQVTDNVLPVAGVVANGGSTNDTTPTVRIGLSGTNAAAGDQVQLFNGTSALGSAIVLTSGDISNGFVDDTTAALAQGTYNFNASITDIAGNTSGASSNYTVTIATGTGTTPPTISSVVASGAGITNGNGDLNAGKVVTLTVAFSEAVTVNTSGGTPTLALNDGGTASYTGGSGSNSLIFSYTVAAGQNTSDLTVTAFNLNGATVRDVAGNDANLAGAVTNPPGILTIDTVAPGVPTITQVTDTGVVANGGSTNDTTPTVRIGLSGTNAAAGDQVQLFNGTSALGSAIVLTSSNISNGFVDVTTAALAQGTYNFDAKITDVAGNTSGASSNYTVTINSGTAPGGGSGTAQGIGAWSAVFGWPIVGIHAIMMPNGKILTFGTDQPDQQFASALHIRDVWDPATNTHWRIDSTTHTDEFCSAGLVVPETGQVLMCGGDDRPNGIINVGTTDVTFFDPTTMTENPSSTGPMQFPRWYASAVQLGTGQILLLGGRDDNPDFNHRSAYAEVYTPGYGFHALTGAYIDTFNNPADALYPRSWLTSHGTVWTSDSAGIYSIDPTGVGSVQLIGQAPTAISWTMPSIMFAPDKVLLIGRDGSAWIMDMSGSTPVFQRTDSPTGGRIWSNLVDLPDGRVMISGGSSQDAQAGPITLDGMNYTTEIWDPSTGHWTTEADDAIPRLYHSTTILLADGSVLSLGGGVPGPVTNLNGEIFKPDISLMQPVHPRCGLSSRMPRRRCCRAPSSPCMSTTRRRSRRSLSCRSAPSPTRSTCRRAASNCRSRSRPTAA